MVLKRAYRRMSSPPCCFHKFTLTSNLIENSKHTLACCPGEGLRARNIARTQRTPPSLIWDKNRLGVRSWGGGGMPENCRRTEVGRLHIYIRIVLVGMVS